MFWGKGDSSSLDDSQKNTLADLRRMVETGHIVALTPEQSEAAIRALDWYHNWEGTFKLLASMRNTAVLLGFLLTMWAATKSSLMAMVKDALQ